MPAEPFKAGPALATLKAFQRRTVDYVFDRFHDPERPAYQFLVADEVGLGKTMVARGVIARTIEHLWDKTDRIDILYICSNQAIAGQNLNRLNVLGRQALALPTRMTLVPLRMRGECSLDDNKVNFISLTPGTTFDLRSSTGVAEERALLFHLLRPLVSSARGLQNLLQVDVGPERWEGWIKRDVSLKGIDQPLIERFRRDVAGDAALTDRLNDAVERFRRRRDRYPREMTAPRNALIARLRSKLSHACVDALQPDLIIMDEFQRFPELLHGDRDAAQLARELFDYRDAQGNAVRTLLLSATPYRMLTLQGDDVAGGPAVCALRALRRVAPDLAWDHPQLMGAAAQVAWGFRTLFNQHDAVALLRRGDEDRYWHRVLTFSAEQNLQAVLDEYAHYLVDAQGLGSAEPDARVTELGKAMADALSIRPSQIDVDNPVLVDGKLKVDKFQMRGRFAMRLADYRDEDGAVARLGGVRDAFNSPFRPFVLATTSVGQEGLDFHPYCYRVYHWNLPGNPVDLEQREGRVHRFKGHAVRLNVAHNHAAELTGQGTPPADPWALMFASARQATTADTDLAPYWLCEGPVKVERRVPVLPFSRETQRLEWLKRSLTVYRLAFGQPRQDDLLNYLGALLGQGMSNAELEALQIKLQP